jgi:hypothetical protein
MNGAKGVRVNNISSGWIVPHEVEHVGPGSFWSRYGFDLIGTTADMERALETGALFNMDSLPTPGLGRPALRTSPDWHCSCRRMSQATSHDN